MAAETKELYNFKTLQIKWVKNF